MPAGNWLSYLRPHSGSETPTALRLVFSAVSGAALSLSYSGFFLTIYSWVCVGILLVMIFGSRRPWVAFGCGFLHIFFFILISVSWVATTLTIHGGLSRAGGLGVLLLMALVLALLGGGFGWTVHRLSQRSVELACIGAPFLWVTFEFIREHLPEIGFPWNLLGYPASASLGFLQITTITGIYGLSFLVAGFNALLAWTDVASRPEPKRRLMILGGVAFVILLVMLIGPRIVPQEQAQHLARAVQVNFPEVPSYPADWFQQHAKDLEEIGRLSLSPQGNSKPDLLIWPEEPTPFSFPDPQFARIASTLAVQFHHPFLVGGIEWKPAASNTPASLLPYNSAELLDAQGHRVFDYDKIHLVPFGEYEPFPLIHRVVASVSDEVGGFHKGAPMYAAGTFPEGEYKFSVFICYEAVFPGEVRRFAANGAQLFINVSNDGWFGRSAAAEQHLRMARVRAVENRRWLIRATNSGYTASVDPYGHIYRPLSPDIRAAADLPYDFRTDTTIYTRFGDWFAWLCVIVSVILLATTFQKGHSPNRA